MRSEEKAGSRISSARIRLWNFLSSASALARRIPRNPDAPVIARLSAKGFAFRLAFFLANAEAPFQLEIWRRDQGFSDGDSKQSNIPDMVCQEGAVTPRAGFERPGVELKGGACASLRMLMQ